MSRAALATSGSRPAGWWGMVWLLATEGVLFACFFAAYYYLRFKAGPAWPPEGIPEPKVVAPTITTAILVASSLPIAVAASAAGLRSKLVTGLSFAAAFVLASLFLWRQADAYRKAAAEFTPQDHAYGSLYYTITGAHAVHVFAGVLLLVGALVVVLTGAYGRRSRIAVQTTALYWHAVNLLAVAVLVLVHLVPRYA